MRRRDYIKIALTDPFCLYMLALVAVIMIATVLFFLGLRNVVGIVSTGGTSVVLFSTLAYVAIRDPKNRFPQDSFVKRIIRVLSFDRGDS